MLKSSQGASADVYLGGDDLSEVYWRAKQQEGDPDSLIVVFYGYLGCS